MNELETKLDKETLEAGYQEYLRRLGDLSPWIKRFHAMVGAQTLTFAEFASLVERSPKFYEEWCG